MGAVRRVGLVTPLVLIAGLLGCQRADPWSPLENRTGWLCLGVVDVEQDANMLANQPSYAFVPESDQNRFRLPKVGETVALVEPNRVIIRNYRISGEEKRLVAPGEYPISENDETPVVLPAGSSVVIEEISRSAAVDGMQSVCVRITPITTTAPPKPR